MKDEPTLEDRALDAAARLGFDVDRWAPMEAQGGGPDELWLPGNLGTASWQQGTEEYHMAAGIADGSAGRNYPDQMWYDFDCTPAMMPAYCQGLEYGNAIRKMFKEPV